MDPAIDLYYRRLRATPKAGNLLEFEPAILRDLTRLDPERILDLIGQDLPALYMTRRPEANADLMVARLLKSELGVEGSDPVHLRFGYSKVIGDLINRRAGNVPAMTLAVLQDGDQLLRLS